MNWSRYAAVGDSFTEGLEDPGVAGRHRGWADRLAESLAADTPGFEYANLAIRGRRLPEIINGQLPRAIALEPDLISIAGGVNDAMRPRWDLPALADLLESGVIAARASGADVLLVTFGDSTRRSRTLGTIRNRISDLREVIIGIGHDHQCYVMDLWPETLFDDPRFWASDRLHINDVGHERVAAAALETLGMSAPLDWRDPLPPAEERSLIRTLQADAQWLGQHVTPWVLRRVTGKSSGDGLSPKHEHPQPVNEPARHVVQSPTT